MKENQEVTKSKPTTRDKAEVVSADDYDGPVFWEEADLFYPNAGDAFEDMYDSNLSDDQKWRESQTLYTCSIHNLVLDADDIIETALEHQEHHESAWDELSSKGIGELKMYIKKWNAEYGTDVATWEPNTKKRVEIPSQLPTD